MIGPNVIQAIIDNTRESTHTHTYFFLSFSHTRPENNWEGFPFLFALCLAASLVIWFGVDVHKGRRDAVRFAEEKRPSKGKAGAGAGAGVADAERAEGAGVSDGDSKKAECEGAGDGDSK